MNPSIVLSFELPKTLLNCLNIDATDMSSSSRNFSGFIVPNDNSRGYNSKLLAVVMIPPVFKLVTDQDDLILMIT